MTNRLKSYFGSKKRRLSDESNDGDKQKKAKEDNLDLTLNQCDADGFLKVLILQGVHQYYMNV